MTGPATCRWHPNGCPPGLRYAVQAWVARGRLPLGHFGPWSPRFPGPAEQRMRSPIPPVSTLDIAAGRASLQGVHLRQLGIPDPLMSDFEFAAAVARDAAFLDTVSRGSEAAYDRRGLLNVIAFLVARLSGAGR